MNQIRITHRSVAIQGPATLEIDGVDVGERFRVLAIGSPEGLLATLERPGGIISQLEQFIDATIFARQSDGIRLPATGVVIAPAVAQPVE